MYRESLQNHRDQILLSKKLATIDVHTPIEWKLDDVAAREVDVTDLRDVYKELEFFSHLKELKPVESTEHKDFRSLLTAEEVEEFVAAIPAGAPLAIAVDAGIGVTWQKGIARAFPLEIAGPLKPLLEDAARPKLTHDAKAAMLQMAARGVELRGITDDVMLYAFLLDADPSGCGCDVLAEKYLDRKLGGTLEARADAVMELAGMLGPTVTERGFRKVYDDIDLPLTPVLTRMEQEGIRVDPAQLGELSLRLDIELARLTGEIHEMAGVPFNINSPQQLAKVLYEDLGVKVPARFGKGKVTSTAADILEEIAMEYPIAKSVLEFRQLAKLKGTYIDALPALIRPATGRIHTTFNQVGAATGRLSSFNPNLQNIPIRTGLGREIRAAFVPRDGWQMVVADYSQIELRLLAHMSKDPVLVSAFRNGEDIHTRTAAEVFGVGPLMVDAEMRRNAKAVNFGIVYGQTGFGLAQSLGIDRREAERYIKAYFERYAGVRKWIDATIAEVRESGVARTLLGRERPIPDMNTRNPNARGFAERTAVNTPLQGTAADLIKIAMIRIDALIREQGLRARMLLQVHDELVLEAPPEESDAIRKMVKKEMEGVFHLNVPLLVDTGVGANWRDAK